MPKQLISPKFKLFFMTSSYRIEMIRYSILSLIGLLIIIMVGVICQKISNISNHSKGPKTYYYTQTLDHFNYRPDSYTTFQQRYIIDSKYWGGSNSSSPIFAFLGDEGPIDNLIDGFLADHAPEFNALIVIIEHRYYGKSVPFASSEEAFSNTSTLGYLNSAQALADYAEVITNLKKNLSAETSPVIVVGGSYGGMLASWFRLKYPHIAWGALASSAPILYIDNITPQDRYYIIVSENFKEVSESCHTTIRDSWLTIDDIASQENGLTFLSHKFKTCNPLSTSTEIKNYLKTMYVLAAQYGGPLNYPVNLICNAIDGFSNQTDIITRILAGFVAYHGERACYDIGFSNKSNEIESGSLAWEWQACTEMIMPIGRPYNNTMFSTSPFSLHAATEDCRNTFGVSLTPRPHWIVTEFGGHDIEVVLRKFSSNIIFSNGLRDPYSGGGVLHNISDSVIAIYTREGSHCLDLTPASKDDPKWLVAQRKSEVDVMKGWVAEYYALQRNENMIGSKRYIVG